MSVRRFLVALGIVVVLAGGALLSAQGRGRGAGAGPVGPARTTAPVDLTGTWVSVVTEDWMLRMRTAPKGELPGFPLTPAGRQAAAQWDPSQDGSCLAYGAGGIMRMPTRLKISWQDDNTLKIETDAGLQTRLLRFTTPGQPPADPATLGARTLQGASAAEWQRSGGALDAFGPNVGPESGGRGAAPRWGSLKVVTTNLLPAWFTRNGAPYGQNATVTEYFTRFANRDAGDWFVVTTILEDPVNLTQPFITSSNFKKEPDDAKWAPAPCRESAGSW